MKYGKDLSFPKGWRAKGLEGQGAGNPKDF
jgi:hypothetical protein